jgi:hypothetical protein
VHTDTVSAHLHRLNWLLRERVVEVWRDMDSELARHLIGVSFRANCELLDLLPILKEHCSPEEYEDIAQGIARSSHAITTALIEKSIESHPELTDRIEADLAKFGRVL